MDDPGTKGRALFLCLLFCARCPAMFRQRAIPGIKGSQVSVGLIGGVSVMHGR
jgi:hypothetical protein